MLPAQVIYLYEMKLDWNYREGFLQLLKRHIVFVNPNPSLSDTPN